MFAGITAESDRGVGRMRKHKGVDVQLSKAPMQMQKATFHHHSSLYTAPLQSGFEDKPFPYLVLPLIISKIKFPSALVWGWPTFKEL